jgi:hypothetical protein
MFWQFLEFSFLLCQRHASASAAGLFVQTTWYSAAVL